MEKYKVFGNDLNSFEDWLHGVAFPRYAISEGFLDDDWTDAEDDWREGMSQEEMVNLADEYGQAKLVQGFQRAVDIAKEAFK